MTISSNWSLCLVFIVCAPCADNKVVNSSVNVEPRWSNDEIVDAFLFANLFVNGSRHLSGAQLIFVHLEAVFILILYR